MCVFLLHALRLNLKGSKDIRLRARDLSHGSRLDSCYSTESLTQGVSRLWSLYRRLVPVGARQARGCPPPLSLETCAWPQLPSAPAFWPALIWRGERGICCLLWQKTCPGELHQEQTKLCVSVCVVVRTDCVRMRGGVLAQGKFSLS